MNLTTNNQLDSKVFQSNDDILQSVFHNKEYKKCWLVVLVLS